MLKIRLQRTGRKNRPSYRIVVCEHTAPVKGKFLEKVGFYDPLNKECKFNEERINYWVSVGAKTSDTVQALLDKKGNVEQKNRNRIGKRKKEREAALAAEEAKEAVIANDSEAKEKAPAEEPVIANDSEAK